MLGGGIIIIILVYNTILTLLETLKVDEYLPLILNF